MLININASAINTTSTAADVQNVTKIQDLSDVDIPGVLDNGQLLIWNGSTMNWENSNTVNNDLTVTGNLIPYTLRANPDTNNVFAFRTTWENYGVPDYDLTTTLTTFRDPGANRTAVHQWRTENNNQWYLYEAIDTGTGDDGTHLSKLTLQGAGGAEITSSSGLLTVNAATLLANANTSNVLKFTHTWENYGTTDYDVTTRFVQFADPGNSQLVVQRWQTPEVNNFVTVTVNDTGTGDDGTHTTELCLQGTGAFIKSKDLANNYKPLDIDAYTLQLNSWNGAMRFDHQASGSFVELSDNIQISNSGGHTIQLTNQPQLFTRKGHLDPGGEITLYRWNNTGTSALEQGSQLALNFNMLSEDKTTEAYVGQFQVIYDDGGQGNTYNVIVNDTLGAQANAVEIRETHTKSQQPFAFPNFTQTEINAMSPGDGWVVYNQTTNKLQVYASGSWVDLH